MGRTDGQMFYLSKRYKLSKEMFLGGETLSARFCLSVPPPPFCLSCVFREQNQVAEFVRITGP